MHRLAITYTALLHFALAVILWKSDFLSNLQYRLGLAFPTLQSEITTYYHNLVSYHGRSVEIVPDDAAIFIGDSITQGLAVSAVYPLSVNYGIGGDTTVGILNRLPVYMPALERAKYILIAVGLNDSYYRSVDEAIANYTQILETLPQERRIVVSAILPIDAEADVNRLSERVTWRREFNNKLKLLADEQELVTFVDSTAVLDTNGDERLDTSLYDDDGVHLNIEGNRIWAQSLRNAILSLELE